jgi:hypothetical protein
MPLKANRRLKTDALNGSQTAVLGADIKLYTFWKTIFTGVRGSFLGGDMMPQRPVFFLRPFCF